MTVMEGIASVHGTAPHKKTAPLRDPLLELIDRIDPTATAGLRDRALLLLGFAVGLRRSELTALTVEDLSPSPDGVRIPRIARDYGRLLLWAATQRVSSGSRRRRRGGAL